MPDIQAVLFDSHKWTDSADMRHWLHMHGFTPIKRLHRTLNLSRYRIKQPNYNKYIYRIKHLNNGVSFVLEYPK